MAAPEVRTPRWDGADAESTKTNNAILPDADAARIAKLHRNWPALAALQGFELQRMADGRWHASRWNLSRELDEAEVPGWLQQIGVRQ